MGEIEGRCKSFYFVLTLVRENHILVREKSGNFKVDLLCEPCRYQVRLAHHNFVIHNHIHQKDTTQHFIFYIYKHLV